MDDVSLESQFASEATFNRAFRRTFGIPPGEARLLASPSISETPSVEPWAGVDDRGIRWIKQLGADSPARDLEFVNSVW
ncbi:MAG TPA: hypothetical protein VGO18_14500 [Steroidobacteraceae bacterium]|jgi:AraC-like DNA-binding protein|nr:hypothetical protein [Steroidobacteraceae bacterium]